MDHPTLNQTEKLIAKRTLNDLRRLLTKSDVPPERWGAVRLAVVVELAGEIIDAAPARHPLLCNQKRPKLGRWVHCTLRDNHEGDCDFEEAP